MSNLGWLVILVSLLTLLGSGTLFFITIKYYWGERGTPPLTGKARRLQKEEELRLRAAQIEQSKMRPRTDRSPDFWDNTKRS
jgi:hypothetical protein